MTTLLRMPVVCSCGIVRVGDISAGNELVVGGSGRVVVSSGGKLISECCKISRMKEVLSMIKCVGQLYELDGTRKPQIANMVFISIIIDIIQKSQNAYSEITNNIWLIPTVFISISISPRLPNAIVD